MDEVWGASKGCDRDQVRRGAQVRRACVLWGAGAGAEVEVGATGGRSGGGLEMGAGVRRLFVGRRRRRRRIGRRRRRWRQTRRWWWRRLRWLRWRWRGARRRWRRWCERHVRRHRVPGRRRRHCGWRQRGRKCTLGTRGAGGARLSQGEPESPIDTVRAVGLLWCTVVRAHHPFGVVVGHVGVKPVMDHQRLEAQCATDIAGRCLGRRRLLWTH